MPPDDWMTGMPTVRLARWLTPEQIRQVMKFRRQNDLLQVPRPNPQPGIPYVGWENLSAPHVDGSPHMPTRVKQSALDIVREKTQR